MDEPGEWLTSSEAASRRRWHLPRAQSRARREGWPKRRSNRGTAMEYLIPASLLASPDVVGDGASDDLVGELQAQVADLREQLGVAKGELTAELRRRQDLVERAAELRAERDRLAAELAEARKPWLVRVVEAVRRREGERVTRPGA
jgi:ribosome-binding protein aMBF1 (putative translation factor)